MPKPRIFAKEFRDSEHNERKPHAYGKPRKNRRKACDKSNSPQIFKSTYADDGRIPLVLFRNVSGTGSGIQIDGPKSGNKNDECGRKVECRQNGNRIRNVNIRRNGCCKSRNGF